MKRYQIIYADPPWKYNNKPNKKGRTVESHYPTMDIDAIKNLPVNQIAGENCILFLWTTFPMLQEGLDTVRSWGFKYKTVAFTWIKSNKREGNNQLKFLDTGLDDFIGMGRWTRSNAEVCLLGTKGKPKRISEGVRQIIYAPIMEHSRKPDETKDRIVELCGDLPRVELFARQKTEGWDVWGNEVESDIKL